MPRHITEYFLYRWRYSISYVLVGLLVSILLVAAVLYVPGGLSKAEIAGAVKSSHLSLALFDPAGIIDLPYTVLQRASFAIFGITTLSIKLPSFLIGLVSLIGVILLLRHWFHANVAVIAALIVITASQFIFASQDGTPTIMYIFISTWLLYLALKVSRQVSKRSFWEFILVATVALSLYTPLSIYIILALASATILHPHLRFIVGHLSRRKLLGAGLMGLILLAPLITALIAKPDICLTLLGIPSSWPDFKLNGIELLETHLGFIFSGAEGQSQPVYTLPSLLLTLLGITHLVRTRHTARSYITTSWLLLLMPIILINPTRTIITFVPVMLLIAAGIEVLLRRWYSLFPRNPYARIAGLFPITLLLMGMSLTGIERYFYIYRYSPPVAANFSNDLNLLDAELKELGKGPTTLIVTTAELPFYQAVANHTGALRVAGPSEPIPADRPLIATRNAFYERALSIGEPARIITNGKSDASDRLYLYKTTKE